MCDELCRALRAAPLEQGVEIFWRVLGEFWETNYNASMIYTFADFVLDTETVELTAENSQIALEPQVFSLLVFLIENRGRVVSRDEIVESIWDGRFISDSAISSRIKSLRKALGDDGKQQKFIKTVQGSGFRFVGEVSEAEDQPTPSSKSPANPVLPAAQKPVIAVLPFDNMSAESEEYFADGLTEDIITNLSRFRDLQVIARTSTFHFKGRTISFTDLSKELGANYIVEGSVRRAGDRVRITAQLIDATTGFHQWADTYDRKMEDIFAVQDEVTRTIAATLGASVQEAQLRNALKKSGTELDAYECVLRARRFTSVLAEDIHAEAKELLEKAIELDPSNADAYALLTNVYLAEHRFDLNPHPEPVERALATARKAVELDPLNAYARCWLAIVHFFRKETDQFYAEAERALSLNPNDPETLADIGHYLAFIGDSEKGIELSRRAQELNPLHPGWYFFSFARYHYNQRDYAAALSDVERIGMDHFYWSHMLRAAILGQLGRAEAAQSLEKIRTLKPAFDADAELDKWHTAPDDKAHILEGLKKAGLK